MDTFNQYFLAVVAGVLVATIWISVDNLISKKLPSWKMHHTQIAQTASNWEMACAPEINAGVQQSNSNAQSAADDLHSQALQIQNNE